MVRNVKEIEQKQIGVSSIIEPFPCFDALSNGTGCILEESCQDGLMCCQKGSELPAEFM